MEDNGILLVIDIEKVGHSGGKKVRGYGSSEVAAACVELELDDIQVLEGVEFGWEGDNIKGERKARDEMWFMLRARKGARFLGRMGRRFPGVYRGDMHGSR